MHHVVPQILFVWCDNQNLSPSILGLIQVILFTKVVQIFHNQIKEVSLEELTKKSKEYSSFHIKFLLDLNVSKSAYIVLPLIFSHQVILPI